MNLFTPKDIQERISFKGGEYMALMDGHVLKSVFQPVLDKKTLKTYGFEALIRVYKDGLIINPLDFLSKYKSEIEITNVGILCYAVHIRNAQNIDLNGKKLFINAHPKMFSCIANNQSSISETVNISELCGINPSQLIFEITEFKEGNSKRFKEGIKKFNSFGVNIAIDDYGKSHSDKNRVENISPNIVKIDRSLLLDFCRSPKKHDLEDTLVYLKSKNIIVVIEGVEKNEEFDAIYHLPFDYIQGYLFGKPQRYPCA